MTDRDTARGEPPAILASGLRKQYGDQFAVDDVSFSISPGEIVGFLGPNGAGKTTTMRMLTGFLPATDGSVEIAGHDIFMDPRPARRAVGYLPEVPPLYPEMTVAAYLHFVATIRDVPRKERKQAVEEALERCGLQEERRRVMGALSKGYRQRVGLAQAIVARPAVLVLDEPTVGLDPLQVTEIRSLITGLSAEGSGRQPTVLLSTHILREVEAICERVILMHRGRKVLDEPLSALTSEGRSLEEVFAQVVASDGVNPPVEETA